MNIEELKRLAAEATPGPWFAAISSNMNNSVHVSMGTICDTGKNIDDAAFIAAANPAAVLDLIAEVERVTKQRGELLAALDAIIALPSHPMRKKAADIAVSAKSKAEG